jgi:putative transposase
MGPTALMRKMLQATLESVPIERPKPTLKEPQHLCLDKGYDYDEVRISTTTR